MVKYNGRSLFLEKSRCTRFTKKIKVGELLITIDKTKVTHKNFRKVQTENQNNLNKAIKNGKQITIIC